MKKSVWLSIAVLILVLSVPALAKPNFTGEWKMNPAKSDFGQMPAPSSIVQKITHNEPDLKVTSTQTSDRGEFTTDSTYTTDGKECSNTMRFGAVKSTLKWEGDTLVIESKADFQGNPVTMTARWTLSDDGKTLTINQHFSSSMGEGEARVVFEK